MSISNKTRKLLWGRSGNRCAICRAGLIEEKAESLSESVVGEECHIVSSKKEGPRFKALENEGTYDSYNNLILLCRIHHKVIDDQVEEYSEDKLKNIKTDHEEWVRKNLENGTFKPLSIKTVEGHKVDYLIRIVSGKALYKIIDGACDAYIDHPEPENESEAELFGGFFQDIQDWVDISGDLELAESTRAMFQLGNELKDLEELGYWLFGNIENKYLEGGIGGKTLWKSIYLTILRNNDTRIITAPLSDNEGNPDQL